MKKLISLILALLTLMGATLALASCADPEDDGGDGYTLKSGTYENALGTVIEVDGKTLSFVNGTGDEKARFNFTYTIESGNINLTYTGYDYNGTEISADVIAQMDSYYKYELGNTYEILIKDSDTFYFDGTNFTKAGLDSLSNKLGTGACEYATSRDTSGRDITYVEIKFKSYGRVRLALDGTTAPITVENFISLVNSGFYNGLTIHRVVESFMIQGGDPNANGSGGSEKDIFGEFPSNGHENDISHKRGVISMARSNEPNSASSQFFICNADSEFLDNNYAAFGYVTEGMSVIDDITSATVNYTNSQSGLIYYRDIQPVIEYIKVIEN